MEHQKTDAEVAEQYGGSPAAVGKVKSIRKRGGPEVCAAIETASLSLNAGLRIAIKVPREEQAAAVETAVQARAVHDKTAVEPLAALVEYAGEHEKSVEFVKAIREGDKPITIRMALQTGVLRMKVKEHEAEFLEKCGDVLFTTTDSALRFDSRSGSFYRDLRSVKEKPIEWTEKSWVPRGILAALIGDPEVGKSTLTYYFADRMSRRGLRVGFIAEEDSLQSRVKPFLVKLGAKMDLVKFYVGKDAEGGFVLTEEGCDRLGKWLESLRINQLFVDPINDFFPPGADPNNDVKVRRVLHPLRNLADRLNVGIMYTAHFTKGLDTPYRYRVNGSIAYYGVPRVVLGMAEHPTLHKDEATRVMGHIKVNPDRVSSVELGIDQDGLNWFGDSDLDIRKVLNRSRRVEPTKAEDDENTVKVLDAFGSYRTPEVEKETVAKDLMAAHGISRPTAYRWIDQAIENEQLTVERTKSAPVRHILRVP